MTILFLGVLAAVILQRLMELRLARQNAKAIRKRGGYEVGGDHYKWLVGLHSGFFLSLGLEAIGRGVTLPMGWPVPLLLFGTAQLLRIWCIRSLGIFWNTRIFILPGVKGIRKGPYRWLKHPNYIVVTLELFSLPLLFGLFTTAAVFTLLNAVLLLKVRIPIEEKALADNKKRPLHEDVDPT